MKIEHHLDTCDCKVLLDYDSANDTFTVIDYLAVCSFHNIIGVGQRYDVIKTENSRKNDAYQLLIDNTPLTEDISGKIRLKKGIDIVVSITGVAPDRVITLTVSGITLTQQQKDRAQAFVDNKLGVGKVIVAN